MNEHGEHKQAGGAAITIDGMSKTFGRVKAVDDVSLNIAAGEFLALLGPSGSGKTSILMSIAGFDFPTEGSVRIDDADITYLPAHKRNLGMVFQKYTLFPHLSVRENVAFPLKMRNVGKRERLRRADEALATVRLGDYGDRMPAALSGGQQQRVALARAIVYRPRVLLMDEPLSALDKNLREEMQLEIKHLQTQLGITVVFVTHDQSEALTMADRIAVLKDGQIQQLGKARELYDRPENLFVAKFIGEMNFVPVTRRIRDGLSQVSLPGGETLSIEQGNIMGTIADDGPAMLAIRPEHAEIVEPGHPGAMTAKIRDIVFTGPSCQVISTLDDGTIIRAWHAASQTGAHLVPGAATGLKLQPGRALLYPVEAVQ